MFYRFKGLKLPPYSSLRPYEGKGNYAIKKYYFYPWRPIYRHKLKMIVDALGDKKYHNILDFGSGPGIFTDELKRHANFVVSLEQDEPINPRWKFDVIVCASVLEFCYLHSTLSMLKGLLKPNGFIVVASPIDSWINRTYFRFIKDKSSRFSDSAIISEVSKKFRIAEYKTWFGMYFCLKAYYE